MKTDMTGRPANPGSVAGGLRSRSGLRKTREYTGDSKAYAGGSCSKYLTTRNAHTKTLQTVRTT